MSIDDAEKKAEVLLTKWLSKRDLNAWEPGSTYTLYYADFKTFKKISKLFKVKNYCDDMILKVLCISASPTLLNSTILIDPSPAWVAKSIPLSSIHKGLAEIVLVIMRDNSQLN